MDYFALEKGEALSGQEPVEVEGVEETLDRTPLDELGRDSQAGGGRKRRRSTRRHRKHKQKRRSTHRRHRKQKRRQ